MGRLAGQCGWQRCKSADLTWEVRWSTECHEHRAERLCEKHGRRLQGRSPSDTYRCFCGISLYNPRLMKFTPPVPPDTAYAHARTLYLETGFIADKEAMVAAVTEAVPGTWDTFGSIMADLPAAPPARRGTPAYAYAVIGFGFATALWFALIMFGVL